MSASITLSNVSWSTPDGTPLFSGVTLNFGPGRTGIVGRNGIGKSSLLRLIAEDLHPVAGRIQSVGTIAMMSQETMEQLGDTLADLFAARPAFDLLERAEAGLADAGELADADWTLPTRIQAALMRCGLSSGLRTPLASLSGGQRARAALAALIFSEPDFLLLDEPTNNLDRVGRQAVIDMIRGWKSGAIVVSHDRELLEEMDAIVEITSLGVATYGGNYSVFRQLRDNEMEAARRDLATAEGMRVETARRTQQAIERKARRDSAGQKARQKGDQPKILADAARDRAEASGGSNARLREARKAVADAVFSTALEKKEVLHGFRMDIPPTGLPSGKVVLRLDGVSGGYDALHPVIRDLSLTITGPERVIIAGPNASGKTTLLKLITAQIKPQRGRVEMMVSFAIVDQHIKLLDPAQTLLENFLRLNRFVNAHMAHAALARFGFRAKDALRRADCLSGGERLRAGLACALGATPVPMLLILDEPTNHLDLDGIAALETALAAYDGAVLAISHDETFLKKLAPDRRIELPGRKLE